MKVVRFYQLEGVQMFKDKSKKNLFLIILYFFISSPLWAVKYHAIVAVQGEHLAIRIPENQTLRVGDTFDVIRLGHGSQMIIADAVIDKITTRHCRLYVIDKRSGFFIRRGDYAVTKGVVGSQRPSSTGQRIYGKNLLSEPNYRMGIRFGINLDGTVDYQPNAGLEWSVIDPAMKQGFSVGVQLDVRLTTSLYLSFVPTYSQTTSEWLITTNFPSNVQTVLTKRAITYVVVPIHLKYYFGPLYGLGCIQILSVQGIKGNAQADPGTTADPYQTMDVDISNHYKTSMIGYDIGLGFETKIGERTSLFVEGKLTSSQDNMILTTDDHFSALKPGGGQIVAGLIFDM